MTETPADTNFTADSYLERLHAALATFRAAIYAGTPDGDARALEAASDVTSYVETLDGMLTAGGIPPRAWRTTAPAGSTVHVLEFVHRHGNEITVHANEDGVTREKAAIARCWWSEVKGADGVPDVAPDDDAEAARIYFDTQSERGSESAHSTVVTVAG